MSNEPEYLQRLRKSQEDRQKPAGPRPASAPVAQTVQEQEAIRWAKELAKGTELRSVRSLTGARFAALMRIQGASGVKFLSLEGFATREALVDRVKPGASVGEEVLGAYEVKGGRPVTVATDEAGQIVLKIGAPRPGANPVSPEKMIRRAEAAAAERAKTRPKNDDRGGRRG
ncbi:MAG: hypothetical protein JNJ80_08795 [Gemmatimonadetes bacterium]|nr:hypothetical protein [Gemmatimonadota bacterium]MCC7131554.1 hypothetical protein [Gemmatimonadales bacterium]